MFRTAALSLCLVVALAASVLLAACTTTAADGDPAALDSSSTSKTVTTTTVTTARNGQPRAAAARARRRTVTVPTGTTLQLRLNTAVASDTSRVEDGISADLTNAVVVGGRTVMPAGTTLSGIVTRADGAGRVTGRARIDLDFTSLTVGGSRYRVAANPVSRLASATKGEDATKIGIGAGAGAVIGGLLGGKKGAAEGAAVGGGAGTGVVLATRGREVRLTPGADVSTALLAPLTISLLD